ncbi:rad52/22 family double-strand break repair protein domain-containing protein [Phthorimaea operculella]|nr:rad52/22 family double-strand break repair protein domain-containing protein [Phthorimaea operculella]
MPDGMPVADNLLEDDGEQVQRRQQLINFGHSQWGFNNWSWSVTKQDLDFVDFANGKFCAGVCAFVSVTVKSFDIHRENIGYATSLAANKGSAIHKSRKCAVTNALRETLLSFGGSVATELMELLDAHKNDFPTPAPPTSTAPPPPNVPPLPTPQPEQPEQNVPNKEPKNIKPQIRKEESAPVIRSPHTGPPLIKNAIPNPPPVAKAHPIPANLPPAANRPVLPVPANAPRPPPPNQHPRPNSNVSFVLQPVMQGQVIPPLYAPPPRLAPPHVAPPHMTYHPNYYEYSGPWHFTYESYDRHHGNVNLNFNIPPKNLVVNSRSGSVECKNACGVRQGPAGPEGEPIQYGPPNQNQGCWIKPTIFYDGFWTEQKVKKWVAEQVEKQFPEDSSQTSSPSNNSNQSSSNQPEPSTPTSKS